MTKPKAKHSKLAKAAARKVKWQKRIPGIFIAIIILAGIIFYLIDKNNTGSNDANNSVKSYTAISFTKQGELSFTKADGGFISNIDIELAEDDAKRANGMMYRNEMKENQGMLFIFPSEDMQSFWMMNTVLSLDIIFVNADYEIVTIHKNAKPFDRSSYASTAPAQYVVEVKGGYCDKFKVETGDKIVWRRL